MRALRIGQGDDRSCNAQAAANYARTLDLDSPDDDRVGSPDAATVVAAVLWARSARLAAKRFHRHDGGVLWAHGELRADACSVTSTLGLERTFRIYAIERHGLVWDTRVVPARAAHGAGNDVLHIVLDGVLAWHDPELVIASGAGCLASEAQVDGAGGSRTTTFATRGTTFRAVELRFVRGCAVAIPRRFTPTPATIAACVAIGHGDRSAAAVAGLLRSLGGLAPALAIEHGEPAHLQRCWTALAPYYMQLQEAPSLQAIADRAGVSLRQLARDLEDLIGTFAIGLGDSFRDVVSDVRLRWAVLLLSAPSLTITAIARAAGYGSLQALGRAVRDAGLCSPSAVRTLVLGSASTSAPAPLQP
jgi:AraC-like DNA-binding protein